jgi:chitin disaccharide deacetylase
VQAKNEGAMTSLGERVAERLGMPRDSRFLIVNCDDLGSSHGANVASLKAMELGTATSATLMVPCPWAREAARMFRDRDVGVHLTLTAEYPGYRWRALTGAPSLHDDDGFFPATMDAAVAKARPADVRAECQAQIEQALAWGVDVTHLDAHMGTMNAHAPFFEIFVDLAIEYRLPLRLLGEWEGKVLGFASDKHTSERGILFPDVFLFNWHAETRKSLEKFAAKGKTGVTEICTHPVCDGEELRGYDPDNPDQRANDAACLADAGTKRVLEDAGVKLISYRPLRDLQRAQRT